MARFLPRMCWYLSLAMLASAAYFMPTQFMIAAVVYAISIVLPLSFIGFIFTPIMNRIHGYEKYKRVFGISAETLGAIILAHGIFLLMVYCFAHDILIAQLGCVLSMLGIEFILLYREAKAYFQAKGHAV